MILRLDSRRTGLETIFRDSPDNQVVRASEPEIYPENIPERCKLDDYRFNHEPWEEEE